MIDKLLDRVTSSKLWIGLISIVLVSMGIDTGQLDPQGVGDMTKQALSGGGIREIAIAVVAAAYILARGMVDKEEKKRK